MDDPADPSVWWRKLVDAVVAYQQGNTAPAKAYLRFVAEHRGADVAEQTKQRIRAYARSAAFANASAWPANNYYPVRSK